MVDVDTTFWETLFGGGHGFVGLGNAGGGDIELKAAPPPKANSEEPCKGDRFELLKLPGPGGVKERRLCAYLPESYFRTRKRYPVVFMFGGFMSNEMARLRGRRNATHIADEIFRETGQEAILIGVDASTKTGSSYLEDSPINGPWDTWLSNRALSFIDLHLRPRWSRSGEKAPNAYEKRRTSRKKPPHGNARFR